MNFRRNPPEKMLEIKLGLFINFASYRGQSKRRKTDKAEKNTIE